MSDMRSGDDRMQSHGFPESDWKIFRELRGGALERFCKRVLDEIEALRTDTSRSHHDRYLEIFSVLKERDQELARAFDAPRRSSMMAQLTAIYRNGLLEPDELARFTPGTRDTVESMARELGR